MQSTRSSAKSYLIRSAVIALVMAWLVSSYLKASDSLLLVIVIEAVGVLVSRQLARGPTLRATLQILIVSAGFAFALVYLSNAQVVIGFSQTFEILVLIQMAGFWISAIF